MTGKMCGVKNRKTLNAKSPGFPGPAKLNIFLIISLWLFRAKKCPSDSSQTAEIISC